MVDRCGAGIRWEPDTWLVCFHSYTNASWANRFIRGRFKHVSAFGWVPGSNIVVFVEHCLGMLHVEALPDERDITEERINRMMEGAVVVVMPRGFSDVTRLRFFMSCVSVTAHLLGIRSSALRPDALFRDCLRLGGEVLRAGDDESGRTES